MSQKLARVALAGLVLTSLAIAQTKVSPEFRISLYFDSIRHQQPEMLAFLREMPKGGDLHNHLAGALNAENLIIWAAADGLCVDRPGSQLFPPPCDDSCVKSAKPAVKCAYQDQNLYNSLVDAWSMRNWERGHESGHDHFFATFGKFFIAEDSHVGDALAEAAEQAAQDHLQYVELMHTAEDDQASQLASKLTWDDDFAKMRDQLLQGGLNEVVASARQHLNADEIKMHSDLQCGTAQADPGCNVTVRYIYQVLRGLPREVVFAQMVLGFELAKNDPRFVGLNLVMPEDAYVPMRDFDLHMRMLDYLHSVYPNVHITLHAGELSRPLVPPAAMRSHIRESIELGHAERIGHGVDVMNEDDATGLLHEMASRNILVEVCLTSNDEILGVKGDDHPFEIYRRYGVPVALSTDDEGVSRIDLTHEYVRAAVTYPLSYRDFKKMVRTSLEHSFLPGGSLWQQAIPETLDKPVVACAGQLGQDTPSGDCADLVSGSEKAQQQWELERRIHTFEASF